MALILTGSSGSTTLDSSAGLTFSDSSNQQYAASPYVLKNRIINGGMQVWQRGTSFTTTSGTWTYTADRFAVYCGGASATWSQNTSIPTGFQYSLKMQRTAAQTYTNWLYAVQVIESVNCIDLAGQSVTLSFYAKAGANFSATSSLMNVNLITGTGTDQGVAALGGGTWTGQTNAVNTTQAVTTTWTKYSFTATLGSSVTEIGIQLSFTPTGTAGADDSLYITGVQLEVGSTATPFERRLYNQELANCQRYYWQQIANESGNRPLGVGSYLTTAYIEWFVQYPVQMRTSPSIVSPTVVNGYEIYRNTGADSFDVITLGSVNKNTAFLYNATQVSGTAGQAGSIYCKDTYASSLAFSAEL